MERSELLQRVKAALRDAFGERFKGLILYGSEARGEADPDSDIDLLVLLQGPVNYWEDVHTCIHVLYPLVLEIERPIDATPADIRDYETDRWPLYREVKREGILA